MTKVLAIPHTPIPLPTAPLTSPYTPTHFDSHSPHALSRTSPHILPHSLDYVAKLPCDDVTLINLIGLWKSPIKFFTTTGNLKSCFGVDNANFRCIKVWRSYHVVKLLWQSFHVAKLLATLRPVHTEGIRDSGKPLAFFRKAKQCAE